MNYIKLLISLLAVISMTACSVFGKQGVDIAPYAVVKAESPFEIRQYKSIIIAKTSIKGSYADMGEVGFSRLFKYISGSNQKQSKIAMTAPVWQKQEVTSEKIAMTAPVLMSNKDKSWTMAFVLPEKYSLQTAPKPLNVDVFIEEMREHKVAVLTFSGVLNEETIIEKTNELQKWIIKNKFKSLSEPMIAGYDPPWTIPIFRRNEIQITVE